MSADTWRLRIIVTGRVHKKMRMGEVAWDYGQHTGAFGDRGMRCTALNTKAVSWGACLTRWT